MRIGWIVTLLGRGLAWRLGRAIYMQARGEVENAIQHNGEAQLVRTVVSALATDKPALCLWDVGGNLGEWSQVAVEASAKSGVAMRLDVFEPAPAAFEGLRARFSGAIDVNIHPIALSDAPGAGKMAILAPTAGTNSLVASDSDASNLIDVELSTGAAMMDQIGLSHVDLIKIDAEGFDFAILQGLRAKLESASISVAQFEYNHCWIAQGASLQSVFGLVDDLPYKVGRVTQAGVELYPHWNPEMDRYFESNYALVHESMIERIGARMGSWNESNVFVAG